MRERCGLILVVALVGCARTQQPILYPSAHLQQVGKAQADKDIEACRELASQNVPSAAGKEIAKDTAIGAAGGAAVGAVAGAVSGRGAGKGAAIGAATGGTAGGGNGAGQPTSPRPPHKRIL